MLFTKFLHMKPLADAIADMADGEVSLNVVDGHNLTVDYDELRNYGSVKVSVDDLTIVSTTYKPCPVTFYQAKAAMESGIAMWSNHEVIVVEGDCVAIVEVESNLMEDWPIEAIANGSLVACPGAADTCAVYQAGNDDITQLELAWMGTDFIRVMNTWIDTRALIVGGVTGHELKMEFMLHRPIVESPNLKVAQLKAGMKLLSDNVLNTLYKSGQFNYVYIRNTRSIYLVVFSDPLEAVRNGERTDRNDRRSERRDEGRDPRRDNRRGSVCDYAISAADLKYSEAYGVRGSRTKTVAAIMEHVGLTEYMHFGDPEEGIYFRDVPAVDAARADRMLRSESVGLQLMQITDDSRIDIYLDMAAMAKTTKKNASFASMLDEFIKAADARFGTAQESTRKARLTWYNVSSDDVRRLEAVTAKGGVPIIFNRIFKD